MKSSSENRSRGIRRQALGRVTKAFALAAVVALMGMAYRGATSASAQGLGPTITTDKDDYSPGELVTITGSGWLPLETVALNIHEEPMTRADVELSAVCD